MAFKQRIPEAFIKARPNAAKLPHIYNLDEAVGLHCPNRKLDVMLVQYLFSTWKNYVEEFGFGTKTHQASIEFGSLPATGHFDNRTLAWIFYFQLRFFRDDIRLITGKVPPVRLDASLNGQRDMLVLLNMLVANPHKDGSLVSQTSKWWLDLSAAPGVPAELASALRQAK